MEKKRIIWCDYAAAFQAALECVNTKESQDFAIKFVPKGLPYFTGEGQGLPPAQPGSAWDDWCGEYRRQGNHPAEDQTQYFQTALRCAVKLVLHSLDRGCVELIAALDTVLDKGSAIYSFRREPNRAAHDLAMALHAECTALWREEGGPQKRMKLLDKAPWQFVSSVVKSKATAEELEHVAHLCCKIMQNKGGDTSQMAMHNAFEVLMEVIRLAPTTVRCAPAAAVCRAWATSSNAKW